MTHFERLIHEHVSASVVNTLSRTTEKIAEEMAAEILKDAAFRSQMQALIKSAFRSTLARLADEIDANGSSTPPE